MTRSPKLVVALFAWPAVVASLGCSSGDVAIGGRPDGSVRSDAGRPSLPRADECGNGLDDDGNGRIDDGCPCGAGETQACFAGPAAARATGACRDGTQTCAVEGSIEWGDWGDAPCVGATGPVEEQCDGADNDCDGARDEDCPCSSGATQVCDVPEFLVAPCTGGTQTCVDGRWTACAGAVGPSPDVCGDHVDNDCDGTTDDLCGCTPEPEVCRDGLDNDCDGETDESACMPDWPTCGATPSTTPPRCDPTGAIAWADPVEQCHWGSPGAGAGVSMTPVVIDLDRDGVPEIVFVSGTELVAIRGTDCTEVWRRPCRLRQAGNVAAGDLDGDGSVEIVGYDHEAVRVYGSTGTELASAAGMASWFDPYYDGEAMGVAIADVDGVAPAEVVVGAAVYRFTAGSPARLELVRAGDAPGVNLASTVADLDADCSPEVVSGNRVFDGATGADETPASLAALEGGAPAVAQIDLATPEPEVVLLSQWLTPSAMSEGGTYPALAQLNVVNPRTGALVFGPYSLAESRSGQTGGPPTVVDVDGDGVPEIGAASVTAYTMFSLACAATPRPARCAGPGVLWTSPSQDRSGAGVGAAAFDLDGDCAPEVLLRDECWLRVFEGPTGRVRWARSMTGYTGREVGVIVADTDADGHAELVVASDSSAAATNCTTTPEPTSGTAWSGATNGIHVLRHPTDAWKPARRVWNQHAYHVTNVDEDGRIPIPERRSWEVVNSYRAQSAP